MTADRYALYEQPGASDYAREIDNWIITSAEEYPDNAEVIFDCVMGEIYHDENEGDEVYGATDTHSRGLIRAAVDNYLETGDLSDG